MTNLLTNISKKNILITGAGGFIGGHLVNYFKKKNTRHIRAVDIKPLDQWFQLDREIENISADLSLINNCNSATKNIDEVYNLASNMGGIGFIEANKADCMLNVLINTHMLMASARNNVERYFFSSSACVYAADKQQNPQKAQLKETDAYPAMPEDGYGWEKLFSERMCRHFHEDIKLTTRVARFHNVYGPHGCFKGGREKAPAALCRKIIQAKNNGEHNIDIWGDGEQTRTFMYIDDCLKGIDIIMHSDINEPINLGTSELVSINQLVDILEKIAQIKLKRIYLPQAASGVRGRSSDNTFIKKKLKWEPNIPLKIGLKKLYDWIYGEIEAEL